MESSQATTKEKLYNTNDIKIKENTQVDCNLYISVPFHAVMSTMAKHEKGIGSLGILQHFRRTDSDLIQSNQHPVCLQRLSTFGTHRKPIRQYERCCQVFPASHVHHHSWCPWGTWTFTPEVRGVNLSIGNKNWAHGIQLVPS